METMIPSGRASRWPIRFLVRQFPTRTRRAGIRPEEFGGCPRLPQFIGLLVQEPLGTGHSTRNTQHKETTYGSHAGSGF